MRRNFIAEWVSLMALAAWTQGPVLADSIPVPNGSFESPATFYVSINIDFWQKSDKPESYQENGGLLWTQLTGIFTNSPNSSDHIDNCDGNQALWVFAVPEVGLFQDYDSTDWHNQPPAHQFDATFKPGKSYRLTVGVIGTGGGMLEGATLDLSLYYRDSESNQITVGVTTLTNTPTVFSNNTHLVDCKVDVPPVKPADAWAGQHIGIQFKSTVTTNLQGGYWDLDNVRLSERKAPVIVNPFWTNGQFGFILLSEPGTTFDIQSTTNLPQLNAYWMSVGIVTNATGTNIFSDSSARPAPRFYRARQLE